MPLRGHHVRHAYLRDATSRVFRHALCQVEHVIREDRTIEAYEIISLMCELLVERLVCFAGCLSYPRHVGLH